MRLPWRLAVATLVGLVLATSWFAFCYWLSQLPVVSPVSLSLSVQPWWKYWPIAAGLFCLPLLALVVLSLRRRLLDALAYNHHR
jgi:hypothetical protein